MYFEFDYGRESPFQPGIPVSPDKFMGRKKTIEHILRHVTPAIKGQTQHFFLTGKRRMGKTSLTDFVKDYVDYSKNMIGVYVSNKGNNSIEILTKEIIEALINELPPYSRMDKIKKWFGNHIESIELNGTKITFEVDKKMMKNFKNYFPDHILEIYKNFPQDSGILIIIDDINGLSKTREFADWYKKLADTLAVSNHYYLPVYFLLAGYPEKFEELVIHEESFGSIFDYDFIDCLSDEEVIEFFKNTFNQVNIEISDEALEIMTLFSSGVPLMMQQIGDSIFWICQDNYITKEDAINGIIDAANMIGTRQIKPILKRVRIKKYGKILNFLADNNLLSFNRLHIKENMDIDENSLDEFLSNMVDVGIFEFKEDKYQFANKLYYTYFLVNSIK